MVSSSHLSSSQEVRWRSGHSAKRVAVLEQKVVKLEELPAEVAGLRLECSQFRDENAREHSAMRQEMSVIRLELDKKFEEAKRHALVLHEHLVDLIKTLRNG